MKNSVENSVENSEDNMKKLINREKKLIHRDKEIKIRLSEVEHKILKEKADKNNKPLANFIRDKAIGKKLPIRATKNNQKGFLRLVKQ